MKTEDITFSVWIESHNSTGERGRVEVGDSFKRSSLIRLLDGLGFTTNWTSPYSWAREKNFPLSDEEVGKIQTDFFIRIGEYIYDPILYVKRQ